jgi:hypothetical protein
MNESSSIPASSRLKTAEQLSSMENERCNAQIFFYCIAKITTSLENIEAKKDIGIALVVKIPLAATQSCHLGRWSHKKVIFQQRRMCDPTAYSREKA